MPLVTHGDRILFTETFGVVDKQGRKEQLTFLETRTASSNSRFVSESVNLIPTYSVKQIISVSVSDILNFQEDETAPASTGDYSDKMAWIAQYTVHGSGFEQVVERLKYLEGFNAIVLNQVTDVIEFSDNSIVSIKYVNPSLTDILRLHDSYAVLNIRGCPVLEIVNPTFLTPGGDSYEPNKVYNFGNLYTQTLVRVVRTSPAGDHVSGKFQQDTINEESLQFEFSREEKAQEGYDYFDRNYGKRINFKNHVNVTKLVLNLSDQLEITQTGRSTWVLSGIKLEHI